MQPCWDFKKSFEFGLASLVIRKDRACSLGFLFAFFHFDLSSGGCVSLHETPDLLSNISS